MERIKELERYLGEHGEMLSNQEQLIRRLEAAIKRIVDVKRKLDQMWAIHHQSLNEPAQLQLWREAANELDAAIREASKYVAC